MTEQLADTGSTHTDTSQASNVTAGDNGAVNNGSAPVTQGENQSPAQSQVANQSQQAPDDVSYSYEPPEGAELDSDLLEYATPVLKQAGINAEQAKHLLRGLAERDMTMKAIEAESVIETAKKWEGDLRNDPEFGGQNFDKNVAQIRGFMEKAVPENIKGELYEFFNDTGLGSHPAMVKFMHSMASRFQVSEDQPNMGRGANAPRKASVERRMYGTD